MKNLKKISKENAYNKLKDFYKENYDKTYYLVFNEYIDDCQGYQCSHDSKIAKRNKRVAYYSTDENKAKHRENIDRIVIDADEGVYKALGKIQTLLNNLKCEYWIIAGTDKKDKPSDSGSIVIMFQPMKANKNKFNTLMRCFNLHVGDLLNVGYMHKNPQWEGVNVFEKIQGDIIDFDTLYNKTLSFYGLSEIEIEEKYKELSKKEYAKKCISELSKEKPDANKVQKNYEKSHKEEELTEKVNSFLNNPNIGKTIKPIDYALFILYWEFYFDSYYDKDFGTPISIKEKFGYTEKIENLLFAKARIIFEKVKYCTSETKLRALGFISREIEHIKEVNCIWREKGLKKRRKIQNEKNERIIELNRLIRLNKITEAERIELKELTCKKTYKKKVRNLVSCTMELEDYNDSITKNEITINTDTIANNEKKKRGKYETLFINEKEGTIITKDSFVENYCGGKCYDITRQTKRFGFRKFLKINNKTKNIVYIDDKPKEEKIKINSDIWEWMNETNKEEYEYIVVADEINPNVIYSSIPKKYVPIKKNDCLSINTCEEDYYKSLHNYYITYPHLTCKNEDYDKELYYYNNSFLYIPPTDEMCNNELLDDDYTRFMNDDNYIKQLDNHNKFTSHYI